MRTPDSRSANSPDAEVTRNERGYRVGECHHRSTVPDAVVHELRDLHEFQKLRYAQLIELFAQRGIVLRYSNVKRICNYTRRADTRAKL